MHEQVSIERWRGGRCEQVEDVVAVEEPIEIRVRGKAVSVTMRTPGHDDELAAGFLISEGVIGSPADVARIDPCVRAAGGNIINVFLRPTVEVDLKKLTRHVFASSSCGVCGKASIDAVHGHFDPVRCEVRIAAKLFRGLPAAMRRGQQVFERTGGLHAAAVFDEHGELVVLREDVGRHNAVDKVLGQALLRGRWPLERHILLISGRASFEIMQKALAGRLPIVCAVGAPSSLAVGFARDSGQTLIGFLGEGQMNVYSEGQRVVG